MGVFSFFGQLSDYLRFCAWIDIGAWLGTEPRAEP